MKNGNGFPRLLADVGGTHARFASQFRPQGPLEHCGRYACADFETLWDAISHHLWREGLDQAEALAVAVTALRGSGAEAREVGVDTIEAAVLDRQRPRRTFRRLGTSDVAAALA